jgi:hypothetical protein
MLARELLCLARRSVPDGERHARGVREASGHRAADGAETEECD